MLFIKNKFNAFTLIELIVVIAIISILVAIAIPILGNLTQRANMSVDLSTLAVLNRATIVYRISRSGNDPYLDESLNNFQLIEILVDENYLDGYPEIKTNGLEFIWDFDKEKWFILNNMGETISSSVIITDDDIVRGTFNWNAGWILHYKGNDQDLIIPESLGITTIAVPGGTAGNSAFMGKNINSVILPNGLTTIGSQAFRDNNIVSIIIPDSVKEIQSGAFRENPIDIITIGNSVEISNRVFGIGYNGATEKTNKFKNAYTQFGAGTYYYIDDDWVKN